ncbi:hypothetical protein Tco_1179129, partial [Tanacetum coccineum]
SESENESWGDSRDDVSNDDDSDDVSNDDDDVDSDANGDNEASDSDRTDFDEDENPNLVLLIKTRQLTTGTNEESGTKPGVPDVSKDQFESKNES